MDFITQKSRTFVLLFLLFNRNFFSLIFGTFVNPEKCIHSVFNINRREMCAVFVVVSEQLFVTYSPICFHTVTLFISFCNFTARLSPAAASWSMRASFMEIIAISAQAKTAFRKINSSCKAICQRMVLIITPIYYV